MDDVSPERKSASYKWQQAQQEMQKGHHEKAIDLARSALDDDPTFLDVRMWIAHYYIYADEERKAARELEEVIYADREHEEAWELLRRVDPAVAERLDRLQHIAPDPFVSKRTADLTDDIGSMDDLLDDDYEEAAGEQDEREIGADPFVSQEPLSDDIAPLEEEESPATQPTEPAATEPASDQAPAQDTTGGYLWEHEQDRPFLAKWEAETVVATMTAKIQELWDDPDAWDSVLALCAHAEQGIHPRIFEAAEAAAGKLGVQMPELLVFPERCMHPVIIKDRDPMVAVPTGLLRAMTPDEMLFQIGREIGHLHTGYIAQMQAVKIVTNRKAQLAGDLASTLRDFLGEKVRDWQHELSNGDLVRLQKLGHAWQQRCELTADRAGLICCGDAAVACSAMAKTTARSIDEASVLTVERFLAQFEGQDVGELAAIPVQESPSRNSSYVAYRIHMLRWWATTPEAMQILSS